MMTPGLRMKLMSWEAGHCNISYYTDLCIYKISYCDVIFLVQKNHSVQTAGSLKVCEFRYSLRVMML